MTPERPNDRIFLHDHIVEVEIGAFQQERGVLQRLRFDVDVEIAPPSGPVADDVDRILSYDRITEAIADTLAAERLNLLETLAEGIAARILAAPQALRVHLRIEKLDRGPFVLGIEVTRDRSAMVAEAEAAVPRIIYLGMREAAPQAGAVHCVASGPAPVAPDEASQRRVDLLALDQAAWMRAARHPDFHVAATRTEMDWALRAGRAVLWAPSKMVLDAVVPPETVEPAALALWLAGELGATELLAHDNIAEVAGSRVQVVRA